MSVKWYEQQLWSTELKRSRHALLPLAYDSSHVYKRLTMYIAQYQS
jgi:hypothetical protein